MKVAVLGCGHWGRNYLRVLHELRLEVVVAADEDAQRLAEPAERWPSLCVTTDAGSVLSDPGIDAVVIATPAVTHHGYAEAALQHGKHVLVEKPMTLGVADAERLVELAARRRRTLMVGHTFLYNASVRALREIVRSPESGSIYYLTSRRNHLGLIREDVSALWDLAPHDISMFLYLLGEGPEWVSGSAGRFLREDLVDTAFATLGFAHNVVAHLEVSWVDAHKVRELAVVTSCRRVVFDDLDALEPIRVYEKGVTIERDAPSFGEFRLLLRDGAIISPRIEQREPLRTLLEHFVDCVEHQKTPLSDGQAGLEVVRVLAALQRSIEQRGAPLAVPR
jgi:predicted dehydrogenase